MTMITNNFDNLVNETAFVLQQQYHGLKKTICALPTIYEDFEWKPTSNHADVFEEENTIVRVSSSSPSVIIVVIPQRPRSTGFHADELSCEWAQQLGFHVRTRASSVSSSALSTRPRRPRAEFLDAHAIARWMMDR
jgi:hypothetical protein